MQRLSFYKMKALELAKHVLGIHNLDGPRWPSQCIPDRDRQSGSGSGSGSGSVHLFTYPIVAPTYPISRIPYTLSTLYSIHA